MPERRLVVAILALTALLGFQLAKRGPPDTQLEQILSNPIEVGQTLRGSWRFLDGTPFTPPGRCWHGYFSSPSCSWCRKLAENWSGTESRAPVFWLFSGSRDEIVRFGDEYGIPGDSILVLDRSTILPEVGVFGTPTQVSLTYLTVVNLQIPQAVLQVDNAEAICSSGR